MVSPGAITNGGPYAEPTQLALALDHAESLAREDFLADSLRDEERGIVGEDRFEDIEIAEIVDVLRDALAGLTKCLLDHFYEIRLDRLQGGVHILERPHIAAFDFRKGLIERWPDWPSRTVVLRGPEG